MKKIIVILFMLSSLQTTFAQRNICNITCCLPNALQSMQSIRKQFKIEVVDPVRSTYQMRFTPTATFLNLVNAFDNYNRTQVEFCYGNRVPDSIYKTIHQFFLWEITNATLQNATGNQILNTHIHIPSNRIQADLFYGLNTINEFSYIMQPNKWYVIQYGYYFSRTSPFSQCGYNGAAFAVKVSDTGNMRIVNVQTNEEELIKEQKNSK